jgi:uncharacterized membrane protein YeaQ/YmgE (transglycosylase-associated protein family)
VIGREDLIGDPRFDTQAARLKHEREVDEMIAAWTRQHEKREAMRLLGSAGVPAGAIFDTMECAFCRRRAMGDPTVGWIAAIIIGGIAGWLAEQFMKSDMGLLMNIVLGIVGAAVASAILSFFGIALGGWLGYLIAGFIGACLLIWVVRWIQGARRTA